MLTLLYSRSADEVGRWAGGSATNSAGGSESGICMSEASSGKDLTTLFWNKASDSILVVDDSADMRVYLMSILSRYCKVVTASNGEEALALAIANPPDLIISFVLLFLALCLIRSPTPVSALVYHYLKSHNSDISMPKLDGLQLLAAIRANKRPEVAYIPLILVTAKAGSDDRVAGLLAGAEDFLSKPFSGESHIPSSCTRRSLALRPFSFFSFAAKELVARSHLQMQLGKKRIEMEKNFREQEAATRLLSDAAPTGISRWNANGDLVYVNDAWYNQSE